jgi:hypothetical protein
MLTLMREEVVKRTQRLSPDVAVFATVPAPLPFTRPPLAANGQPFAAMELVFPHTPAVPVPQDDVPVPSVNETFAAAAVPTSKEQIKILVDETPVMIEPPLTLEENCAVSLVL